MSRNALASALICAFLLSFASTASAGPYGDALGKCLVKSITTEEKTTLLRWTFFMLAAHPKLRDASATTPEQRTALSKRTAKILERLLTQSCAAETLQASRKEGAVGLQTSLAVLNQLALTDLLVTKEVTDALTECIYFVDREKLKKVVVPQEK
jgi:hypothetical protein